MKPLVAVMTDIWPSVSHPENGPYVRELAVRMAPRVRQVVLVPRLVLPRIHRRIWGDAVQGLQRGHDEPAADLTVRRYPMLRVPKGTETAARVLGSRLVLASRRERPALVHGHFLFGVAPAAVRLGRSLGAPVLLTAHGTDVRWLGDRSGEIQGRHHAEMVGACLAADAITVAASWMVEHFISVGVPEERITVASMGVDEVVFAPRARETARAELGVDPGERAILFVGRATPEKGARVLADAVAGLEWHGRPVRCYVAGAAGLRGATHLGMLASDRLAAWMAATDLVCLPSFSEGMSVAVSEALACGTPVVASAVGGLVEQIEPGVNGLLVPPGDAEELRSAIADALDRDWEPDRIRETSERFWWSSTLSRFDDLYRRLLGLG